MHLSKSQIETYRRDGAVLVRGVLDRAHLDMLECGLEGVVSCPGTRSARLQGSGGAGETLLEQFSSDHSPALRELRDSEMLASLAAQAMGVNRVQLILEQTFYKQAGQVQPTPWHQDTPFLCVRGDDMVRAWMSCDPSPRELTVQVVRGSHRWNVVYDTATRGTKRRLDEAGGFSYAGIGNEAAPKVPDIARHRDSFDILRWDVEPGDVLLFNGNILHGADGCENHPSRRRTFAVLWGAPTVRYQRPAGHAVPTPFPADPQSIADGTPIAQLEHIFPVAWSRAEVAA